MTPLAPFTLSRPATLDALGAEWRALEARAEASFFQSWTWVGCLAQERFPDPVLLRAGGDGQPWGLALLNRTGPTLWLGESGTPALDAVYVEHNGPLLAQRDPAALAGCLRALLHARLAPAALLGRRLLLAGVDDAHLAAARAAGAVHVRRSAPAPYVDLAALGPAPGAYLASLSANTRQQIRRSDRHYGPLSVRRAASVEEAWGFLDALAALHQARWTARGRPGAFANPAFRRFHRALLARAVPRGEAELLCIAADDVVGYLYNFRYRGRVLAYQSGFDYKTATRPGADRTGSGHAKPGLTCHHAAIALARNEAMTAYDFLAGDDRYKTSMAGKSVALHWLEATPRWSARGFALQARGVLTRARRPHPSENSV